MSPSLDDLVALVKARGTADSFPEREELHSLLDPFRALPDQESVRLALAATVRKGDRLVARVAAEALAYLGGEAATSPLIAIVMDASLGTSQRAAAAWAMEHRLPKVLGHLAPDEQFALMSLPVFEMLEDPEEDHGFGLQALLGSYVGMPPLSRGDFLAAIGGAARERGHKIAGLWMHLVGAEADGQRRRELLDLVAAEATQDAADLLASFAAKASDVQEAKHARKHLHLLRAKGLRGVVKPDLQDCRALVTGVDGDACFSVNFIIPRVPTFDLANLLFHLESGLRDGFTMQNLPGRSVDDLVEQIKEGCGGISCFVPMPLAARIVDEAMRSTKPAVLRDPDLAKAIAMAEPALTAARRQPWVEPEAPADAHTTAQEVRDLLDSEGFESWFFEAGEATVKTSVALLDKPIRSKGKAGDKVAMNLIAKATKDLVGRLRADGEHLRLERMLRHQARLLEHASDTARANLCRKLSAEVLRPESQFLSSMAAQALYDALEAPAGEHRPARFIEAREHLRSVLGREGQSHQKIDVARLDLAAVAHAELVIRNREMPSAKRIPLTVIEDLALKLGELLVGAMTFKRGEAAMLESVAAELEKRDLFRPDDREEVAAAVVSSVTNFRRSICDERCPHRCFADPHRDGRAAYYAEGQPWGNPDDAPSPPTRN